MDKTLTLVEHLGELRKRVIVCLFALGLTSVFSFPFACGLLKLLKLPAHGLIEKLAFFSPEEAFLIYMRIAFLSGIIISMPVILYQAWGFISPAVEERFRRYAFWFILACLGFFIGGCLFAYFILIPPALKFLLSFALDELAPVISAGKYISFVTGLIFGCGLVFQMPVLSLILTKLKVINSRLLRQKYKYALVIILLVAAIITPTPDAFNMFLLAAPMLFLYEAGIWIAYLVE